MFIRDIYIQERYLEISGNSFHNGHNWTQPTQDVYSVYTLEEPLLIIRYTLMKGHILISTLAAVVEDKAWTLRRTRLSVPNMEFWAVLQLSH